MTYAKTFFDLQLRFARTVSRLSGLPLDSALLEYTNFYVRFGLGRDFDPAHPGWRAYVAGLRDTTDHGEWTHRFYMRCSPAVAAPAVVAAFGCFAYARLSHDRIRLHFQPGGPDGCSPLSAERRGQRLADLAALFAHVKHTVSAPQAVVGASWLYNLDAYRCLFPKSYLATARVVRGRYRHMPLWGQFVNRFGEVKERPAHELLERLRRQSSLERLDECFPLQVLGVEASVVDFYDFYGV